MLFRSSQGSSGGREERGRERRDAAALEEQEAAIGLKQGRMRGEEEEKERGKKIKEKWPGTERKIPGA